MPTGYTAELEKNGYAVKKWIKESVVRAMGVCVTLRDNGSMSQKEIEQSLAGESDSYYTKRLKEVEAGILELNTATEKALLKRFASECDLATKKYQARLKEHKLKSEAHLKSTTESKALLDKAIAAKESEFIINTLKFAVEQLESSYRFDYGGAVYKEGIIDLTFEQWKATTLKELEKNKVYYELELAKEQARVNDRHKQYLELVKFVDSN